MALVKMSRLLQRAASGGVGCGAFSVGNMEMIMGAVRAAETLNTPIILQIAEVRLKHSPLELIGPMMVAAARNASVDVAVHLDHGLTTEVLKKALDLGFTSVMMDSSAYPLEENISRTEEAVMLARQYDADVEAELGIVGGSEDGSSDQGILCTDPDEAVRFCEQTKIQALAVAIGNAHGNYPAAPKLAFDVLATINEKLQMPLVLHGGSGITDDDFKRAISLGIRKINIATASFNALTRAAGQYLADQSSHNFFSLNEAMIAGVYENARHHIQVFNSEI